MAENTEKYYKLDDDSLNEVAGGFSAVTLPGRPDTLEDIRPTTLENRKPGLVWGLLLNKKNRKSGKGSGKKDSDTVDFC